LKDLSHEFNLLTNEDANGVPSRDTLGRESYLFIVGVSESDANRIIELCNRTNIYQFMHSFSSWSSRAGHYLYNLTRFPRGADSLRDFSAALGAEGIGVGIHTFVSKVSKYDSYVTPVPDHRFWVDHETTLATGVGVSDVNIQVTGTLDEWPGSPYNINKSWEGGVTKHMDVIIGDEIIQYTGMSQSAGSGVYDIFTGCKRGAYGTIAATHNSGIIAKHWGVDGCINGYIIDQETTLIDEVTQRMADIVNDCNFNMINFDGYEDVPKTRYEYYSGLCEKMTVEKVNVRPLKHLGNSKKHRLWHSLTTGSTVDTYLNTTFGGPLGSGSEPSWNRTVKDHINWSYDRIKGDNESLFSGEFGWFGIWSARTYTYDEIEHHVDGLQLDETEYLMCKCLSINSPLSLETTFSSMDAYPLTGQILDIIGVFEGMRADWESMDPNLLADIEVKDVDYSYIQKPDVNEFVRMSEVAPIRGSSEIRCWVGELADGNVVATLWQCEGSSTTLGLSVSDLISVDAVTALNWWGEAVALSVVNDEIQIPVGERRLTLIFDGVAEDVVRNYLSTGHKRVVDPHQPERLGSGYILASASSEYVLASRLAEDAINGSGLDATGLLHSEIKHYMWSTEWNTPRGYENSYGPTVSGPAWIAFDFDKPYNLDSLWVWNFNRNDEVDGDHSGLGMKDVTIQYCASDSMNSADWVTLGSFEFAKAPAVADYAHNTEILFNGATVKKVVITGFNNWNDLDTNFGLSEVCFNVVEKHAANPLPADDSNSLAMDVSLSWQPGSYAASSDVYIGTDFNSLRDAETSDGEFLANTESNGLNISDLEFDTKYYWAIDSTGDPFGVGYVWNFTTREARKLATASIAAGKCWWEFDDNTNSGTAGAAGDLTFYYDAHIEADAERGNVLSLDGEFWYDFARGGVRLNKQAGTISHWLKAGDISNRAVYYEAGGHTTYYNGFGGTDIYEVHTGVYNGQWYVCYQDGTYTSVSGVAVEPGVWTHVAVTWDRAGELVLYVNGEVADSMDISGISFSDLSVELSQFGMVGNGTSSYYWKGAIDDARIYDEALTAEEIGIAMSGGASGGTGAASNPEPEHSSEITGDSVTLSWEAGTWSTEHDVYIGTDFNSVAGANRNYAEYVGRFTDANVVVDGLDGAVDYYWVVDEVNGEDKWLGDVWQFSTVNIVYDYEELAELSDNWLSDGIGGGDFDGNGTVDFEDFAKLGEAWLE
jgi:hypothetical protein